MSLTFDDADQGTKDTVDQLNALAKKREAEGRGDDAMVLGLAAHMVRLAAERDIWKSRALESIGSKSETQRRKLK
jgi:hypothetical protein